MDLPIKKRLLQKPDDSTFKADNAALTICLHTQIFLLKRLAILLRYQRVAQVRL
jgi:hypothetical protein